MDSINLRVCGREMSFQKEELERIVESYLLQNMEEIHENIPKEGEYFVVDYAAINKELFSQKRSDAAQETVRKLIEDAIKEVDSFPEKYKKPFKTMIPKKTWENEEVKKIKESASAYGGHLANWVEQALEWAQRISNGESWENVCNIRDIANWYRLIVWKDGHTRKVGGSNMLRNYNSATSVSTDVCYYYDKLSDTVPLIVMRDEELHTA